MKLPMQQHFFTVDVEEHFQVSAFDNVIARESWSTMPSRVVSNTTRILELLHQHGSTATFFTLGWVAERYPELVRAIVDAGHEVASHGYGHMQISRMSPQEFRDDVRIAKQIIEDASGRQVLGYRAPSFSISPGMEWAFDILVDEGHVYDSSLFPIKRPGYGYPGAPPLPHLIQTASGPLLEFPLLTTTLLGVRLPAAGGAYFRHLPIGLTRRALHEHNRAGLPGMFYIHPWEIDVDQPRIRASALTTVRHYGGIRRTLPRLIRLLGEFTFSSVQLQLPDIAGRTDDSGMTQIPGP